MSDDAERPSEGNSNDSEHCARSGRTPLEDFMFRLELRIAGETMLRRYDALDFDHKARYARYKLGLPVDLPGADTVEAINADLLEHVLELKAIYSPDIP